MTSGAGVYRVCFWLVMHDVQNVDAVCSCVCVTLVSSCSVPPRSRGANQKWPVPSFPPPSGRQCQDTDPGSQWALVTLGVKSFKTNMIDGVSDWLRDAADKAVKLLERVREFISTKVCTRCWRGIVTPR